jgi:hypothetical protein
MLTETLLLIPFSVIVRCSPVPTSHWLQGKCARMCIFSVKIAALGSLKQITGRVSSTMFSFRWCFAVPVVVMAASKVRESSIYSIAYRVLMRIFFGKEKKMLRRMCWSNIFIYATTLLDNSENPTLLDVTMLSKTFYCMYSITI